jgi:YHS domain-containing protein
MRNLILLIFVVIFYYFIKSLFTTSSRQAPSKKEEKTLKDVDDMVKDPSCETYIPKSTARSKVFNGERYYFCSDECLEKFKENNPG